MKATPAQIAAYVGKSERTIHRWLASGKWAYTRLPGGLIEIDDALLVGPESEQESQVLSALRRLEQKIDDLTARVGTLTEIDRPRRAPVPATPRTAATTTPRLVAGNIPAGLVAWRIFSVEHGIPESTTRRAIDRGDIPMIEGSWLVGNATIKGCLDGTGKAAFYRAMSGRPQFVACPDCPHS